MGACFMLIVQMPSKIAERARLGWQLLLSVRADRGRVRNALDAVDVSLSVSERIQQGRTRQREKERIRQRERERER